MKILNLGCGHKRITPGAGEEIVNHDRTRHHRWINAVWDLNVRPWPWEDKSFDTVLALSVFEHLEIDLVQALDECWRILKPGGTLNAKVPHWQHDNAYADPTHRWRYSLRSFDVVIPGTRLGKMLGFYTARKWEIVNRPELNDAKSSVHITMRVCK